MHPEKLPGIHGKRMVESTVSMPCVQILRVRASDGLQEGEGAFSTFLHQTWHSSMRRDNKNSAGLAVRPQSSGWPEGASETEMGFAVQ